MEKQEGRGRDPRLSWGNPSEYGWTSPKTGGPRRNSGAASGQRRRERSGNNPAPGFEHPGQGRRTPWVCRRNPKGTEARYPLSGIAGEEVLHTGTSCQPKG